MTQRDSLANANILVAVVAFGAASCLAVLQALSIADVAFPGRGESFYYLSVTAHGVLMALVFTTFFIMGLGYALVREGLGRIVGERVAWIGFWVALVGTVATTITILMGKASVLYTFYPPLKAHPAFYIGATLLIVGSWIWGGVTIASYRSWKSDNPGTPAPLAVHGMLVTVIIWFLATAGLAIEVLGMLIPWSLGWVETIDPVIARTYFWWFGHPLVYFWLLPAYVVWYAVLPKVIGGRVFSDPLARMVFVLFVLFSTPVGFHHQFSDPGISSGWKLAHTVATYAVLYPSLITAFTVIASLEVAGRLKGANGLLDWIGKLPWWKEPLFSSVALAMITFAFGGFGGAINAAYSMNGMVHNTAWIQGHFHLTVGTATALTFMGATYWLLPRIAGRELRLMTLARLQPWLWAAGMTLFSASYHIAGILGLPRRVYSASFLEEEFALRWAPLTKIGAVGGVLLFISAMCFVLVTATTWLSGRRTEEYRIEFAKAMAPVRTVGLWDRLGLWTVVAVILVIAAYAYPILHLYGIERFGSPGFSPF